MRWWTGGPSTTPTPLADTPSQDYTYITPGQGLARRGDGSDGSDPVGGRSTNGVPRQPLTATDLAWRGDPADLLVAALDPTAGATLLAAIINRSRPPWMVNAACGRAEHRGVQFHPDRGHPARLALDICDTCEVIEPCRLWAMDDPSLVGVLGGTTARQRAALRARDATESKSS